jgi:hypothetical protein
MRKRLLVFSFNVPLSGSMALKTRRADIPARGVQVIPCISNNKAAGLRGPPVKVWIWFGDFIRVG